MRLHIIVLLPTFDAARRYEHVFISGSCFMKKSTFDKTPARDLQLRLSEWLYTNSVQWLRGLPAWWTLEYLAEQSNAQYCTFIPQSLADWPNHRLVVFLVKSTQIEALEHFDGVLVEKEITELV